MCSAAHGAGETSAQERLIEAIKHVDRLTITPPELMSPASQLSPDSVQFEIKGHAQIENLVRCLEFLPPPDTFQMSCE